MKNEQIGRKTGGNKPVSEPNCSLCTAEIFGPLGHAAGGGRGMSALRLADQVPGTKALCPMEAQQLKTHKPLKTLACGSQAWLPQASLAATSYALISPKNWPFDPGLWQPPWLPQASYIGSLWQPRMQAICWPWREVQHGQTYQAWMMRRAICWPWSLSKQASSQAKPSIQTIACQPSMQ